MRAIQNARLVAESQLRVHRNQMPALIDTATYKTPKRSQMSYRDFKHIMNIVTTPLGVREGYGDTALEVQIDDRPNAALQSLRSGAASVVWVEAIRANRP